MPVALQFSVLVPLEDERGEVCEHLRTWTHQQRFPRERFQVVLAAGDKDPKGEAELEELLEPQDVIARADTNHVVGLWREAAARATAPWLILTEAHCQADPGCLAAAASAIAAEPGLDAAMFAHGHIAHSTPGELTARWFRHIYAQWSTSEWAHLNLVGMGVRRELFVELDAFHERYGLFCAPLLSARLHERGAKVAEVPAAMVRHVYHDTLREHHENSADSTRGECTARSELDADFVERYFGRLEMWSQRLQYRPALAREVTRALLRAHATLPWVGRELASWLPRCAGRLPRAWERLDFALSEWLTERLPLPGEARWKGYLRAQERIVHTTRVRWLDEHVASQPSRPRATGVWSTEQLDDGAVVGTHALECNASGWFRWTRPAAVLRLLPPPGAHLLRIDTDGMRGPPLDYLDSVHVGGRRLPSSALEDDGHGRLVVSLPPNVEGTAEGIVVLCRPYEPRKDGSSDPRRLGMPIFSIELCRA
jgi:hypothetical protein